MKHAFSIDVEDWYQGLCMPPSAWTGYEVRVTSSMPTLLDLLAKHDVKATCFVLGKVAEEHPMLVRDIHEAGHEIASHGHTHREVFKLTPDEFREELVHSVRLLEDITGEKVIGYRAPYFTITEESMWALDILCEEGILYDSSIHPITHYRCGIPGADRSPSVMELKSGSLLEVPVSTYPLAKFNIPVGGGFYMRFYPYSFTKRRLKNLEGQGEVIGVYTHPWESDPQMPRIRLSPYLYMAHYYNLKSTQQKLDSLLTDFSFVPYREAYAEHLSSVMS